MKKSFLLFELLIFVFITGCGSNETRVASNLERFNNVATLEGFNVQDNMKSYKNANYIAGAMIGSIGDTTIEMIIYNSSDDASKIQENQIENFNLLKATGATIEKEKGSNFYEYQIISNGYYMMSSRIDNTLIFCKVPLIYKDKIQKMIETLGYN